jgi:hypothetical protein
MELGQSILAILAARFKHFQTAQIGLETQNYFDPNLTLDCTSDVFSGRLLFSMEEYDDIVGMDAIFKALDNNLKINAPNPPQTIGNPDPLPRAGGCGDESAD